MSLATPVTDPAQSPAPAPAALPSTTQIDPDDFTYLRVLVKQGSAIELEDGKEYLVVTRLAPVLRTEGLATISDLVAALRRPGADRLRDAVIDAMTTNETSFFRDLHPFEALESAIIPTILADKAPHEALTIWCGASSSGQEPHSLAMMCADRFPELLPHRLKIVATDLSPTMVARCAAGRYTQFEVNRGLPARALVRHFEQDGPDWVLRREIRDLVEVRPLNLMGMWSGIPRCDIVMLRNVLIYFSLDDKREILGRIRRDVLHPGGVLMLGSSETTLNIDDEYLRREVGKTVCYETPSTRRPTFPPTSAVQGGDPCN